jgi:tripartite-type tricarboxylate transporter receptor subunit TctC
MMNPRPSRRRFLRLAAGAAALPSLSHVAAAQAYPSRQINIIVQVPPGGLVDLVARALGEGLAEVWSQTVIVENKAGGNFQNATAYVAGSAGWSHRCSAASSVAVGLV